MHTTKVTAARLGVKESTVRAWLAAGRLGYVKLGRSVRVPESEIQRVIASGSRPARPARGSECENAQKEHE